MLGFFLMVLFYFLKMLIDNCYNVLCRYKKVINGILVYSMVKLLY